MAAACADRFPLAIAGLAVLAACAHHAPTTVVTISSAAGDVTRPMASAWSAVLVPFTNLPGIHGRADISLAGGGQPATVMLFLTGLQPSLSYIWHIRHGPCSTGEPQGPPSEYAPLSLDTQGRGTATGIFPITDPALNTYHIDVHPMGGLPVACGVLTAK